MIECRHVTGSLTAGPRRSAPCFGWYASWITAGECNLVGQRKHKYRLLCTRSDVVSRSKPTCLKLTKPLTGAEDLTVTSAQDLTVKREPTQPPSHSQKFLGIILRGGTVIFSGLFRGASAVAAEFC
jgi:hypothetical protein